MKINTLLKKVVRYAVCCGVASLIAAFAACMQPTEFVPSITIDGITINENLEISGEIEARFVDTAVLWVVNTTQSVDIDELTVERVDGAKGYPKKFCGQKNGSSLASYHEATDIAYDVTVEYTPATPFPDPLRPAVHEGNSRGTKKVRMQMPRAKDYVLYVYRDDATNEIIIQPGEADQYPDAKDKAVPPAPPPISRDNSNPLIIKNLTKTADITKMEFESLYDQTSFTYGDKIKGGDGNVAFLPEDSYTATVLYQKNGSSSEASVNAHIVVIGSAKANSLHTLYTYFYLGNDGNYYITQEWPPLYVSPAASNMEPVDILGDQGLLLVTNHSAKYKIIDGISWGDNDTIVEYPVYIHANTLATYSNQQAIPLPAGKKTLRFKVEGNTGYGVKIIHLEIKPGQVTEVEYHDGMEPNNSPAKPPVTEPPEPPPTEPPTPPVTEPAKMYIQFNGPTELYPADYRTAVPYIYFSAEIINLPAGYTMSQTGWHIVWEVTSTTHGYIVNHAIGSTIESHINPKFGENETVTVTLKGTIWRGAVPAEIPTWTDVNPYYFDIICYKNPPTAP